MKTNWNVGMGSSPLRSCFRTMAFWESPALRAAAKQVVKSPLKRQGLLGLVAALATAMVVMGGCGDSPKTQDKNYFTSGSQEADQRADERMAQSEQLKGDS